MANIKSAIKRARQNDKRRHHNASQRSMLRTYVKRVLAVIETGNADDAMAQFIQAQPVIDKAANKGLIHKNKAARIKSRLVARIKQLSQAAA